ncbi:unnamed protein product [Caenorhabditis auriculariae]|uniref:CX domain-containing protein n=1 Tax=Caenorhabditis auriculariae TaxID=2777116 RepID=A0A8S1HB76_9PELO|nr:unnamed protein product [Caenorhabditis auriculariae]
MEEYAQNVSVAKTPVYDSFANVKKKSFHFTPESERLIGKPVCLIFFGKNMTHKIAWQGAVSEIHVPFNCNYLKDVFCFQITETTSWLGDATGNACCCSSDDCNDVTPTFEALVREQLAAESLWTEFLVLIHPLLMYLLLVTVLCVFVVFEAFCEDVIRKKFAKPVEYHGYAQITKLTSSSKEQMTYSNKDDLQLDSTQESPIEIEKTQISSRHLPVELPEKPRPRRLPDGREQKVSMNYNDSTFSDLE